MPQVLSHIFMIYLFICSKAIFLKFVGHDKVKCIPEISRSEIKNTDNYIHTLFSFSSQFEPSITN